MKNIIIILSLLFLTNTIVAQDSFINEEDVSLTKEIITSNDKYEITPTGINTKSSEIGVTFFKEKYIMYSSRRTGAIGAGKDEYTNEPYNALYCTSIDKTGNLSKPYFFASVLDSKGNEGGLAFSPNEKVIYYTKSAEGNTKNFQLYKSIFDENCQCKWAEEASVDFNSTNYSIENPSVSPDGKKIYFSSNMPGGFGGFDIYVADINEFGFPVNPINLGNNINTAQDEKFPYASPTSKEIYFSSNGHEGFGGQDVFVSRIKSNNFSTPLNLGKTINSSNDEVAFILASKTRGYISSNRSNALGSFDVYKFELQHNPIIFSGLVSERISKIVLPNTKLTLIDSEGNEIANKETSENGGFNFQIDPLESYSLVAKKEGYTNFQLYLDRITTNKNSVIQLEQKKAEIIVANDKAVIAIEAIYFDYNKASVKKESTLSLNKIVAVLIENPEMKIAINAHTDIRGESEYNLTLSEKRAQQAKIYLVKKGIATNRIESKGYGETKTLSKCKENCTETEYNTDRRVEFIIK